MNKILLIEDSKAYCKVIEGLLLSNEYELKVTYNLADGQDAIKMWVPDVVLLDLSLPRNSEQKSLLEPSATLDIFFDDPQRAAIIALTNHTEIELRLLAFSKGVHGFLVKSSLGKDWLQNEIFEAITSKRLQTERRAELATITTQISDSWKKISVVLFEQPRIFASLLSNDVTDEQKKIIADLNTQAEFISSELARLHKRIYPK